MLYFLSNFYRWRCCWEAVVASKLKFNDGSISGLAIIVGSIWLLQAVVVVCLSSSTRLRVEAWFLPTASASLSFPLEEACLINFLSSSIYSILRLCLVSLAWSLYSSLAFLTSPSITDLRSRWNLFLSFRSYSSDLMSSTFASLLLTFVPEATSPALFICMTSPPPYGIKGS